MTVSIGVAAKAKQREQRKQAESEGEAGGAIRPRRTIPIEKVTGVVVGGLVVSAVVYHTAIAPRIGIW